MVLELRRYIAVATRTKQMNFAVDGKYARQSIFDFSIENSATSHILVWFDRHFSSYSPVAIVTCVSC